MSFLRQRPDRELGPIRHLDFTEDTVQILFNRSFGQDEGESNLFICFSLSNQFYNLFLAEGKFPFGNVPRGVFGFAASPADALLISGPKLASAPKTAFDCREGAEWFVHVFSWFRLYGASGKASTKPPRTYKENLWFSMPKVGNAWRNYMIDNKWCQKLQCKVCRYPE
jgi:hypothetical protein